jgi:hypothetical protein
VFTGSSWVHAAIVDDQKQLITMEGKVTILPISVYRSWRSTRVALIRPPYATAQAMQKAIAHARQQDGIAYDPSFRNPDASCTGVIAESLRCAGLVVSYRNILNRHIYGADAFFKIPGVHVIWSSDPHIEHGAV